MPAPLMVPPSRQLRAPIHALTKPIGPVCNLDCTYCYYLKKQAHLPATANFRMSDATLETFTQAYIASHDAPQVDFTWQGGEPTLSGIAFFERALEFQRRYADGRRITNSIQTNGTLLTDEWGAFLHRNNFLVGLSLDGPRELHDRHRIDKGGQPSFARVMRGLAVLQKHRVEFNTLTVVSSANAHRPLDVYRFLRDSGSRHLQFIPLVERVSQPGDDESLAPPRHAHVTPETVAPADYGSFLTRIFDRWARNDVGRVYVRDFDNALAVWMHYPSPICVHAEECGRALAIEHHGAVYSCDHYVYPSHRLGNDHDTPLDTLANLPAQIAFGQAKRTALPAQCRHCAMRFACNGGCPKHRFATTAGGEPGLNYLCAGYRAFFTHIDSPMQRMAKLLREQRPAAEIMR